MGRLAIISLSDFQNWNNQRSLSMGGAAGVIKSILPYLKAEKIFLMGITQDKEQLYKETQIDSGISIIPVVHIPQKTRIPVRAFAFISGRRINSVLSANRITSVYSNAEEISYWIRPGFTVLYHMHGSANALIKSKNIIFRNRLLQGYWDAIRRKNIQTASKVIAIDPLCFEIAVRAGAEAKTILLPNFVDTKVFYPEKTTSALLEKIEEKILLFVGKIEEVKGLELFVDTLIEINHREPGKWKGVLVGKGTYESTLKKYIDQRSSGDLFLFAGPVFDQNELRKIYNRASVLMLSSYFEGIPMVILESLACGTPVVSTDTGGIKALISDNITCSVIDRRDPVLFADKIMSLDNVQNNIKEEFRFSSSGAAVLINEFLNC